MITLPEPSFINRDAQAITNELVAKYEAISGKVLYPAQVERLLIDLIAYAKTMTHVGVQEAAKQNLVHFATGSSLDYLGELIRVWRLPAASAKTILRFTIPAALAFSWTIPANTVVESTDGKVRFLTDAPAVLASGTLYVDVFATSDTAGAAANGFQPGQISALASDVGDIVMTVVNTTASAGGLDAESDDRYRARLMTGPESFSVAGPRNAYRFHAMSAHQSIIDVGVIGPQLTWVGDLIVSTNNVPTGAVYIYPLVAGGVPDADILARVEAALNAEDVRPLCDLPKVLAPTAVDYVIHAALTLYATADAAAVLVAARAAIDVFVADRAAGLGRDVVPSQVISVLSVAGVYQVALSDLALLTLDESQWARCTNITLTIAGVTYG